MNGVRWRTSAGYLASYVAALALGVAFIVPGEGLSMFAPAAGVGALWMLQATDRRTLAVDAALLVVVNVVLILAGTDYLGGSLVLLSVGNLVQALGVRVGRSLLRREPVVATSTVDGRSPVELLHLALASIAAAVVSAPFVVVGLALGGMGWEPVLAGAWVVRNTSGAIVVMATVLAVRGARSERFAMGWTVRQALSGGEERAHVRTELTLAIATTLTTSALVFGFSEQLPLGFLVIATSAWIGFRFTPIVAGVHIVVFGGIAVVATVRGDGPFGVIDDLLVRGIVVQLFVATTAMITLLLSLGVAERVRLADRLRDSEARAASRARLLDAVSNSLTDGIAVVDGRGRVLMTNHSALQMASPSDDQRRVEVPESHGFHRLDGTPLPPEEMVHVAALRGERVPATDVLRIDPDTGAQTILAISAIPLDGAGVDGNRLALVHMHDATQERAETRELQAFAGVVAHDLGNPLFALMNWAEVLDDQLDDLSVDASQARASVLAIYKSGEQMRQLIADLLLLTRTRSSELEVRSVSLDDLVDATVGGLKAREAGLTPLVERDHLGRVLADATLVRQVVANLIGNAVKYVADGVRPVVRLTSRTVDDLLEVRITDNGVGIPAADRGKVFESWFRSGSTSGDYPGTGLGLSITAKAIERHGGTISARPGDDGTGTTFIFTLPLDPDDRAHQHLRLASQREGRTTSAEPPPRRTGSDTAVS